MSTTERFTKFAEVAKNIVVVLALPTLGVYMVKYHNDQMALKDSVIELKEAQVDRAEQFSVERMNDRFSALKNLYDNQLSSSDDSLRRTHLLLDSLSSVLLPFDTLRKAHWKQYGELVIVPIAELCKAAGYRVAVNEMLRDCRTENVQLSRAESSR